jgi:hypothetical protein
MEEDGIFLLKIDQVARRKISCLLTMPDTKNCPCNSGVPFTDCCGAVLSGRTKAATAER